jgi:hypothetical protein
MLCCTWIFVTSAADGESQGSSQERDSYLFHHVQGLHELGAWLQAASCAHVAMESTGVY